MNIQKLRDMIRPDDESPRVAELAALFVLRSATVEPITAMDCDNSADSVIVADVEFGLSPAFATRIAEKLVQLAETLQSWAIHDCNHGLNPAQERQRKKNVVKVIEIGEALGFRVETHGDPRGCVVKLFDPTDERAGDGWGGGWGVYR